MNSASHIYYKTWNAEMVTWSKPTETGNKKSETVMGNLVKWEIFTINCLYHARTQQMSWGNIKHFFFPSQKQTVFPCKCHFFFLFSQSGHENLSVSGSFKCPNPKISLLLGWIFAPVRGALRPFFLSDKSCHYNYRLQNMRKTKHLCSQPGQRGSGSTPGLPSTLHACLQRVNAM